MTTENTLETIKDRYADKNVTISETTRNGERFVRVEKESGEVVLHPIPDNSNT